MLLDSTGFNPVDWTYLRWKVHLETFHINMCGFALAAIIVHLCMPALVGLLLELFLPTRTFTMFDLHWQVINRLP
jgi:hypothetical protein